MEELKEERTSKKRKVTVVATRLLKSIEKELRISYIKNTFTELQEAYMDFVTVDTEYCQLLEADEDLKAEYETVSGLGTEEYSNSVEITFNKAKLAYDVTVSQRKKPHSTASSDEDIELPEDHTAPSSLRTGTIPTSIYPSSDSLFASYVSRSSASPYSPFTSSSSVPFSTIPPSFSASSFSLAPPLIYPSSSPSTVVPNTSGYVPPAMSVGLSSPYTSASPNPPASSGVRSPIQTPLSPFPQQTPQVKVKAAELPHFSGLRKDWPEFKTIWPKLAIPAFPCRELLACELRRCIKGTLAEKKTSHIMIVGPHSVDEMWNCLCQYYDDEAEAVNSILKELNSIKQVKEGDYRGLVEHVNKIEEFFTQLCALNQQNSLNMREVDNLSVLLPEATKREWHRVYKDLPFEHKRFPFTPYVIFLRGERASISRLAEQQTSQTHPRKKEGSSHNVNVTNSKKRPKCAVHGSERVNHNTENCYTFQRMSQDDKVKALKEASACYKCLSYHPRGQCSYNDVCNRCHLPGHKSVICLTRSRNNQASDRNRRPTGEERATQAESHHTHNKSKGLYAVFSVPVVGTNKNCSIFTDDGSDSSYITNKAAKRLGARKTNKYILEVTTTGGNETEYESTEYELDIITKTGKIITITCFGLERITGSLSTLDPTLIKQLFPNHDVNTLTKRGKEVDVLLGTDFFGLHPKNEVCSAGENLSIMEGALGICIQGSHPAFRSENSLHCNMVKVLKSVHLKVQSNHALASIVTHPLLEKTLCKAQVETNYTVSEYNKLQNFIQGEELGTQIIPNCGSCKCAKCPLPGHTFSFQEESELKLIQENLKYDKENECWITKYPWKCDPHSLPNNKSAALATLFKMEKRLNKDENLKQTYQEQMQDMLNRNVAREVTKEELMQYEGPFYYISHLGVPNPRSKSTPYRIVFNSSQTFKGISLNNFLYKGPDAYLNNQLGILLRWREEKQAIVSDIKKMYNSVHLDLEAQHCHRFLWRVDQSTEPTTYCITRVNMGDRPAGAISSEALYKTSEMFSHINQSAAEMLKVGSYVDDLMNSVSTKEEAMELSQAVEEILAKGGFNIKFWLFSGSRVEEDEGVVQVLGVCWKPEDDLIGLQASLNFSPKKQGIHLLPDLKPNEINLNIPQKLTKRIVLAQTMRIYDPLGLISPFTLRGKILLRESWQLRLGWDDPLPQSLHDQWTQFFKEIGQIGFVWYPRVLKPEAHEGLPGLILFSDASDKAFGFVAYARWFCTDGIFRSRLIMSKSRIAPLTKRTTPQLELNAAVLCKRAREVISKEMRYNFNPQEIIHITDSETVLAMLQKTSTRFKLYEGVRVGEIQAASNGDVSDWAWIRGEDNIADWVTRGKDINSLGPNSEWFLGPAFMEKPIEDWGLKRGNFKSLQSLPGEKRNVNSNAAASECKQSQICQYERFSSYRKLVRVIARIINCLQTKNLKSIAETPTISMIEKAEDIIIKNLQTEIEGECHKKDRQGRLGGKYYRLKPMLIDGKWVIGTRLQMNPLVPENNPQYLLPTNHYITRLLMIQAHKETMHRSRDSTLARFRQKFWIAQGSKIADSTVRNCQLCKLRKPTLLKQKMGELPKERTCPATPFTYCMVDYFGPFSVCGEVQKRITGKSWGIIFTDMVSRAVFIEAVFEFNTDAFLIALSKFASIRGYPRVMYSDPGSNFCAASKELTNHWNTMLDDDKEKILSHASEKGMEWRFSTADSPWQNGAVEALVKSAKKTLNLVLQNQRLRPSEFSAVLYGVANNINERPIGSMMIDSDLSILTPNSLLLGRSTAKNPGNWHPTVSTFQRFNLVKQIEESFWKQWMSSTAPSLITDAKWHAEGIELKPGDVVLVQDSDNHKAGYKLAIVQETVRSSDGVVRKARVLYKSYRVGDKLVPYQSTGGQSIFRPVQKLALVVPVEQNEG